MKAIQPLLLLLALLSPVCSLADDKPADFTLTDTSGTTIKLSDYRGNWVVVNFWATWCATCAEEIPRLIDFQKRYPGIRLLGINFEQQTAKGLRPFLSQFQLNYPQLLLRYTTLSPFEPLKGLPTTAIVNPQGNMVSKYTGPITVEMLEAFFRKEGVIFDPKATKEAEEAKLAEEQAAREKAEAEAQAATEAKEAEERAAKEQAAKARAAKAKAAREKAAKKAAAEAKAKAAAESKAAEEAKAAAETKPQAEPKPEGESGAKVAPATTPPPAASTGTKGTGN